MRIVLPDSVPRAAVITPLSLSLSMGVCPLRYQLVPGVQALYGLSHPCGWPATSVQAQHTQCTMALASRCDSLDGTSAPTCPKNRLVFIDCLSLGLCDCIQDMRVQPEWPTERPFPQWHRPGPCHCWSTGEAVRVETWKGTAGPWDRD